MPTITNYSNAIFLISPECRAFHGTFEADDPQKGFVAKREMFKSFNKDIKPNDLVMVETGSRHNVSVVKIVACDVEVDFNATERTRWIIGKVDMGEYDHLAGLENDAIQKIKAAELRKQRDDLKKTMFADHIETLKELELAKVGTDSQLPPPKAP